MKHLIVFALFFLYCSYCYANNCDALRGQDCQQRVDQVAQFSNDLRQNNIQLEFDFEPRVIEQKSKSSEEFAQELLQEIDQKIVKALLLKKQIENAQRQLLQVQEDIDHLVENLEDNPYVDVERLESLLNDLN